MYENSLVNSTGHTAEEDHPARRGGLLCLDPDSFDAVIFDLDGTLVDSMGMWGQIDVEFLDRFGIEVPEGLQKTLEGMTWSEMEVYFHDHFPIDLTPHEIGQQWLLMASEKYRKATPAKDGAVDFVRAVSGMGKRLGVSSSNHLNLIEDALEAHGILPYFGAVTTCDEVSSPKPNPEVYLLTARKLGVQPERCLVFEDIPVGIMAGKNAGMRVIAVEDAYSASVMEEKRNLADGVISSYRDIRWRSEKEE